MDVEEDAEEEAEGDAQEDVNDNDTDVNDNNTDTERRKHDNIGIPTRARLFSGGGGNQQSTRGMFGSTIRAQFQIFVSTEKNKMSNMRGGHER